jgi:pimeloyl-ACP methyl ester carboxylesterase
MKRLLAAAAAGAALLAVAGALLVERALQRPTLAITAADRATAHNLARDLGAAIETVSLAAADGVSLQGWLFTPREPNGHAVVLLHGIASNRAAMLPSVGLFLEHGYRALALDARAHGDSSGGFGTLGALEAGDLRRWIERLASDVPEGCVYSFGQSLGAAIALQASDAPGLCAVVAESGFAGVREIAFDRVAQKLGTGPWAGRIALRPGIELALLYARLRFGVDLAAASARQAVAQPGVPILVVHGVQDDNTPLRHAEMIAAANRSRVSLWLVPGGHLNIRHASGADYAARVLSFIESYREPRFRSGA